MDRSGNSGWPPHLLRELPFPSCHWPSDFPQSTLLPAVSYVHPTCWMTCCASIIICSGAHWPCPLLFSPLTVIGVLSTFSFTSAMTGGETNSQEARLPAFPTHRDVRVSLLSNNHKEGNVFTIWQISWCCGRTLAICHPSERSESRIGALQCRAADSRGQGRWFPSCRRASGIFLLPLSKAQCKFPDLLGLGFLCFTTL